jgi:hypothetical protein
MTEPKGPGAARNAEARGRQSTSDEGRRRLEAPRRRAENTARQILRRLGTANETWTMAALVILMAFFTFKAPGKFLTLTDLGFIATIRPPCWCSRSARRS